MADAVAERHQRCRDVSEIAVLVVEDRNRRALELSLEVLLAGVGEHEIGPKGEDALEIRIDQCADAWARLHFGRVAVEVADTGHFGSGPDGKEHFCQRWHQRHDPLGR